MKKILKIVVPILLALVILCSICWYFFQYDTTFTHDLLLRHARQQDVKGNYAVSAWLYDLAYRQREDEQVAIELSNQYKTQGNYSKAESTLAKALANSPSLELYMALTSIYIEQDKIRDAVLMLDKVSDPDIQSQLQSLRPAAPVSNAESGTYMQYISVEFTGPGTIYVNCHADYPSIKTDLYTDSIRLADGQTTLFAVSIAENGLVSPLSVYHYVIGSVVEEVIFADEAFEAAVRTQLGVDNNYVIYSNNLWDIKTFTVPADAITCSDLRWMPYLETLTIENATFEEYTALQELTSLKKLTIHGSRISDADLNIIADLPILRELTLRDCSISSIEPLSRCTTLTHLDLSSNAIRDISALSSLSQLHSLSLRSNAVISADALAGLSQLQELDISYNSLTTTQPIGALIGLVKLDVSANDLMNLNGLGTLYNMVEFVAGYNNLTDIAILRNSTMLETLNVSHNTLLNIDVIVKLPNLVSLDFSHNEVTYLPKLDVNCALQTIDGSYNALTSLNQLSKLENLTHVYMDYADINSSSSRLSNIDSLQHCPKLQEVHVYGTKVRNVSKLTDKGILVRYTPA